MFPGRAPAEPLVAAQDLGDLLADRVDRVERGHRFLENHRNVIAADIAQAAVAGGHQILAIEKDAAASDAANGWGSKPIMASAVIDLPQPDSPTRARSAGPQAERQIVDHRRDAVAGGQLDAQVADLKCRGGGHQRCLNFGFKASLSPSPTNEMASTVTKIAMPGMVTVKLASRI